MTELPCKDCKFCKSGWHIFPFWRDYSFSKCHRPENYESSPVTGHLKYETVFCSTERKFDHRCGEEAKFFDPKPGKEIKYYGVVQKKNERREAMSRMWADLKKAGANVYELLGVYTLPGNPTDYSLKDLKQKYISGELTQVEKELKEKEIALKLSLIHI